MGDYLRHLDRPRQRPRRGRALLAGVLAGLTVLTVAGGAPLRTDTVPGARIGGLTRVAPMPTGRSWAPAPVAAQALRMVATAGRGAFALHTAGGVVDFLPGVNLGSTTPGHQPGEMSVGPERYRSWFAAMSRLGIRAVRIYTIHPPAFYRELVAHNRSQPTRPLYLVQGVYPPDESYLRERNLFDARFTAAFRQEVRDAAAAVTGDLVRPATPGRASGTWDTDATDWLAAWIIGLEWDPNAVHASDLRNPTAPPVAGRYFRSTPQARPTERWLAARMDELATLEAAHGRSVPIAFVNWPTTDPLQHPDEPLAQEDLVGVDANHIRSTAAWPAGTFASYHAYPYYPDFQRHEPALQSFRYRGRPDPYAGYLAALRRHHGDIPVLITEFGVPSSLGSAHNAPLGRTQGDHSEQQAMRIDAELLRMMKDVGLAGGFLFAWTDEWFKFTWNTVQHTDGERRQLWHDPLTNEQHFGLLAMDAAGSPDTAPRTLLDAGDGRPARRVTAAVDESYLHLRITLAASPPGALTIGLDVLPTLTGPAAPGTDDRQADAAFVLDLPGRTGQAYLRDELDPMPLDYAVPPALRGPAPAGWRRFQLIVNRDLVIPSTGAKLPVELTDPGRLRHGSWNPDDPAADSRSLWRRDGDDLVVRVPWAMAGFADPSAHRVAVPRPSGAGTPMLTLPRSPGVAVTISAAGTEQRAGLVTWDGWQRVYYTERLKQGAGVFRDALAAVVDR